MRWWQKALLIAVLICGTGHPALSVEGPTAAGPIGGTDIRSATLPPPGLYGGVNFLAAGTIDFVDGQGRTIPALKEAQLAKQVAGPYLYYVPNFMVFGGHLGFGGVMPLGNQCGHLFIDEPSSCTAGLGDPYVEIDWSRSFGQLHTARTAGAYPILRGLSILVGFGVVLPAGNYDANDLTAQALSIGTNIWDFAPTFGVTYTTRPILAEGTEVSAKFYWNKYLQNPRTKYRTGDLLNLDFAVTEHVGRFQIGATGFYAVQIEADELLGRPVLPDGREAEILHLGGIIALDVPEHSSTVKLKALTSLRSENTPTFWSVVLGFVKKI
jgi:hypothetical protein